MNIYKQNTDRLGLAIQAKQEGELAEFMSLQTNWVLAKAHAMLKNMEDAEEATNAVFLHVWQKAHKWDPKRGAFGAWFNRVVSNFLLDMVRKQKRRAEKHPPLLAEGELFLLETHALSLSAEQEIVRSEAAEQSLLAIEDALEQIDSPKYRICWILKRFEGYKQREIAEMLNMHEGSVKIYIYRCEQKLREILENEECCSPYGKIYQ